MNREWKAAVKEFEALKKSENLTKTQNPDEQAETFRKLLVKHTGDPNIDCWYSNVTGKYEFINGEICCYGSRKFTARKRR